MNTKYKFFLGSAGPNTQGYKLMRVERAPVYARYETADVYNQMVSYIQRTTKPKDPIYIVPFMGLPLYFLADRKNPSFYEWILPPEAAMITDLDEQIINSLEKTQTKLIIYYDFALDGLEERRFKNYAPKLYRYILDNYYLDKTFENYWMMRRGPSNIAAVQHQTNSVTKKIFGDLSIGQTFFCKNDGLNSIKIRLTRRAHRLSGYLDFYLSEAQYPNKIIRSTSIYIQDTILNEWFSFSFPTLKNSKGKRYYFYVNAPKAIESNALFLGSFLSNNYPEGTMFKDHKSVSGDLSFVALKEDLSK